MAPPGGWAKGACSVQQSAFADAAAAGPPLTEAYSGGTAPSAASSHDAIPAASFAFVSGGSHTSSPYMAQQQQQQWQQSYQAGAEQQSYSLAEWKVRDNGTRPGVGQYLNPNQVGAVSGSFSCGSSIRVLGNTKASLDRLDPGWHARKPCEPDRSRIESHSYAHTYHCLQSPPAVTLQVDTIKARCM